MKQCSGCLQWLPLSAFSKHKLTKDGLWGTCKACKKLYDEAYYEANKERLKKQNSTKGTSVDSPQRNWHREDYERNKAARLAQQKVYYAGHWPEQYERTRNARINIYNPARRARLLDAFDEEVDRRAVWGRDEGHCRIKLACNGVFVPFDKMHLDHVVPLSKGGRHSYSNVQTSCAPCNQAKGTMILESR